MPPENHGVRKTTFISVSTMDEIPVLSEAECAHMLESLAGAEADAAAGRGRLFDADVFVEEAMKRWATFKMKTAR